MKPYKLYFIVAAIFLMLSVTSCSSQISIASSFQNTDSATTGRYYYYSGARTKTIDLEEGQTIILDYTLKVSKGALNITLVEPCGAAAWSEDFSEDSMDKLAFQAVETGVHKLVVTGKGTSGSYNIKLTNK